MDTKRFAKDITKEIDIIDENTKLKNINNELHKCLIDKEKEIEILKEDNKIIRQKNEILKGIIDKHNININIKNNKESIKQEIPSPPISPENIRNNVFDESTDIPKVNIKKEIIDNIITETPINKENINTKKDGKEYNENKFSNNTEPLKSDEKINFQNLQENVTVKGGSKRDNKTLFILDRFPITIYKDINNNEVYKLIAAESALKVKYRHEIAEKSKKDKDSINTKEIIDYIINHSDKKINKKEITRLRRKFQRCYDLYDLYGEKLNTLHFSIYNIGYMQPNDWDLWLKELDNIIKKLPKNCNYIYRKGDKKGEVCGIYDCKDHKVIK